MKNIFSVTYAPKQKDPFTGEWNNKYLVPALKDQQNREKGQFNYVAVTCTPSMNGVYYYPAEKTATYKRWQNGNTTCLYVPIEDCECRPLEHIRLDEWRSKVKSQQEKWLKNQVKNRDYTYKKGKPDWML